MASGFGIFDNVKFLNRLSFLVGGLAVFIFMFSLVDYAVQNWFQIEHITIEGNVKHVTSAQLSYIAKNRLKGTFFTLDIDNLQDEFKKVPWVKSVVVSREFPDSITVNITEYDPIARMGDEGFLAQDGQIFNGAVDDNSLPIFYVPSSKIPTIIADYNLMMQGLNTRKINVVKFSLSDTSIAKIDLSNNLQVIICGSNFADKWAELNTYWDKLYQLNPDLHYVNLCYKNAVAINSIVVSAPAKIAASNVVQRKIKK